MEGKDIASQEELTQDSDPLATYWGDELLHSWTRAAEPVNTELINIKESDPESTSEYYGNRKKITDLKNLISKNEGTDKDSYNMIDLSSSPTSEKCEDSGSDFEIYVPEPSYTKLSNESDTDEGPSKATIGYSSVHPGFEDSTSSDSFPFDKKYTDAHWNTIGKIYGKKNDTIQFSVTENLAVKERKNDADHASCCNKYLANKAKETSFLLQEVSYCKNCNKETFSSVDQKRSQRKMLARAMLLRKEFGLEIIEAPREAIRAYLSAIREEGKVSKKF